MLFYYKLFLIIMPSEIDSYEFVQAWEEQFQSRIMKLREHEFHWLSNSNMKRSRGIVLFLTPVLISSITFGVYILLGNSHLPRSFPHHSRACWPGSSGSCSYHTGLHILLLQLLIPRPSKVFLFLFPGCRDSMPCKSLISFRVVGVVAQRWRLDLVYTVAIALRGRRVLG